MTLHYHATPITPLAVLDALAGHCFCVSHNRPEQVFQAHAIGQSVMLDNGAFSAWRSGHATNWADYYDWAEPWLDFHTTWAVIPDVIDGDEAANEALIEQWPHGTKGAPVWHMHESIGRLLRLAERFPRVCIGSSQEFSKVGDRHWHNRMVEMLNILCGNGPPPTALHMLRGLQHTGSIYPFASADGSGVARNHHRVPGSAKRMATMFDAQQCPARWSMRPTLRPLILPLMARHDGKVLDL
jgi:hypothetical protein